MSSRPIAPAASAPPPAHHAGQAPVRRRAGLFSALLLAAASPLAHRPAAAASRPVLQDCRGHEDTLRLDSLPWPVDSGQAVRRARLALHGPSSLELPVRVTAYERGPARVRLTLATDVEPRVVLACGSGRVALYANGVTVVEQRTTARTKAPAGPSRRDR